MAGSDLGQKYQRILQMFWDPEPRNDEPGHPPIYCLGKEYLTHTDSGVDTVDELRVSQYAIAANHSTNEPGPNPSNISWPEGFLDDFNSRFWFTYRNDFPTISRSNDPKASSALTLAVRLRNIAESSGFTSDTGWGCMIRSGQCLVGNTLAILHLGRDWRRGYSIEAEKQFARLFADDPRAHFSIHKFVSHGASHCGKHPGEWFGPSATADCIKALLCDYKSDELRAYVAKEGAQVYDGSVINLANWTDTSASRPVLILAGVRLGIDRVTPTYQKPLKRLFRLKQFVGIAGGRPSASHYFVAAQGDHFFYLDPHNTRPGLSYHEDLEDYTDEEIDSLHTRRLRRLHVDKMDPSMLLAFLVRSTSDYEDWKAEIRALPGNPILTIVEGEPPTDNPSERLAAVDEVETFDDEDGDESIMNDDHQAKDTVS